MAASGWTTRKAYAYEQLSLDDDHLSFALVEQVRSLIPSMKHAHQAPGVRREPGLTRGTRFSYVKPQLKLPNRLVTLHDGACGYQSTPSLDLSSHGRNHFFVLLALRLWLPNDSAFSESNPDWREEAGRRAVVSTL